jgi:transcription antitermination factor NusG
MAKRWYIVHGYSNFENKVAESIREQAKQRGLSDLFEEVMMPKEKVMSMTKDQLKQMAEFKPLTNAPTTTGAAPGASRPAGTGRPTGPSANK